MAQKKKNRKLLFVASFEDASILRKFTILFLVASIIPLVLLFYIYLQNNTALTNSSTGFGIVISLMAFGVAAGYLSMRSLLIKMINITKENRAAMESLLSPDTIKELNQEHNEIVVLSRSFSAVTKQLEANIHSLEAAKKTIQNVMAKVGQGISNMENIDTFLLLIVETMTNALNGRVGTLLLLNDKKSELLINTVFGAPYNPKKLISIKLSDGSALRTIMNDKRPKIISGVFLKNMDDHQTNDFFDGTLLCAPLIYRDRVNGIMTVCKNEDHGNHFSQEDIDLFFNLASQTTVALENSKLDRDIEKTYFETISALALAVDAKDKYSRGHLDRVAEHAIMIGKHLGLEEHDLQILRDGARLHDVGKIGIPDEILCKEGVLTDDEWVIMRRHTEIGESILKPIRSLAPLCDLVRHHHEKLDGTGYPDRLKGDEISPLVRILTVADIYDALTTERPYRPKRSFQEAANTLRSMSTQLDQDIVELLLEQMSIKLNY